MRKNKYKKDKEQKEKQATIKKCAQQKNVMRAYGVKSCVNRAKRVNP